MVCSPDRQCLDRQIIPTTGASHRERSQTPVSPMNDKCTCYNLHMLYDIRPFGANKRMFWNGSELTKQTEEMQYLERWRQFDIRTRFVQNRQRRIGTWTRRWGTSGIPYQIGIYNLVRSSLSLQWRQSILRSATIILHWILPCHEIVSLHNTYIIIIIMNFYSPVSNTRCHSIGHNITHIHTYYISKYNHL